MIEGLNLRHLRSVAAIARLGSISAAATQVNISQPAITQGLSKLEAQLGIALFHRLPEGMQPTEAAALLVPRIERALDHVGSPLVTMAQMRALLTLGEAGSYAGASAITGLSQPALHRALADLAIVLRRPLVERRGKGIGFTHGGRRTVRAFRLARAELRAGLAEVEALKGHEFGRVAIGAMPLSRARILPEAVAAFHLDHPEARILISEGAYADLIEPLRDGDLDLIVGALRAPSPGGDVEQQPLFLDRPAIIGRKHHPLACGIVGMAQLAEYPWIASPAGTPLHGRWRAMFENAGLALPKVPIECGSVIAIRQILASTDFLAMLSPDQVGLELSTGLLGIIAEVPAELGRTIGITTRSGWRPTMIQAAFIEQLRRASGAIDASRDT